MKVTVRRAGWISWLVGRSEQVSTVETTPEAHVTGPVLHPGASGFVRVTFDQPVQVVSLAGPGVANGRLRFAVPQRVVATGVRAAGANRAGSLRVAASPRAWESLTAPVRLVWFPRLGARSGAGAAGAPSARLRPTDAIEITFSQPVADLLGNGHPTLTPATAGRWSTVDSHTIAFQPSGAGFGLGARVEVTLPRPVDVIAGAKTVAGATLSWQVPVGSTLRLQQLLAGLGYLPLSWRASAADVPKTAAAQNEAAIQPPAGAFTWRYPLPAPLRALWSPGNWTTMMQGAVMAFQSDHHLVVDGLAGPRVWHALIGDALAGKSGEGGYSYVLVHRDVPQRLELWHDGAIVLKAKVNTGVPAAPTPLGTHPVFEHIPVGTMSGRNPDGSHYRDPGILWISYFNHGEAIHGFDRATYGFPQSVGCVEVPNATARQIWPYTPIGTLVTISL